MDGDARSRLVQKLKDCFEEYKSEWLGKSPATLIEEAEEIAAMQRMMRDLPTTVTEEDAAYLLRFQNPLEVVSDYWQEETNSPVAANDRLAHVLWEIVDKQAAEQEYALEQKFQQSEPSQTQQQTM